ncbi:MAG: hypothetical protein Q7O66_03735 [Dehalococcoidia bacterium]|nr:hypothetical protein [Dehalococcoidia bacterium]
MRIIEKYSHLNGWEHFMFHKPQIWRDATDVIALIDAEQCRTKVSNEKGMIDKLLFAPKELNRRFKEELERRHWKESRTSYYEGELYNVIRQGRGVPAVPLVIIGIAP